jgi:hypoxanthine-guanine phosphoribosyltransferase
MRKVLKEDPGVITHTLWGVKSANPALVQKGLSAQPEYFAAKKDADYEAAYIISERLVSENALKMVADKIGYETFSKDLSGRHKPVVVAPVKAGSVVKNLIPLALAHLVADRFQLEVCRDIYQRSGTGRTGRSALDRLLLQPEFTGKVERGRKYIIVDDVLTMGGSIAGLASYIESNGGKVICTTVLANQSQVVATAKERLKPRELDLLVKPQVVESIERKFGWRFGHVFEKAVGFPLNALTFREGSFVQSVFESSSQFTKAVECAREAIESGTAYKGRQRDKRQP